MRQHRVTLAKITLSFVFGIVVSPVFTGAHPYACGVALVLLLPRRRVLLYFAAVVFGVGVGDQALRPDYPACHAMHVPAGDHVMRLRLVKRRGSDWVADVLGRWKSSTRYLPGCGRATVRWSPRAVFAGRFGDEVLLRGRVRPPRHPRNPAEAWRVVRDRVDDIGLRINVPLGGTLRMAGSHLTFRDRMRRRLAQAVKEIPVAPARAVLSAMLLGDTSHISQAQRNAFARSGLSHLLAVSGFHLAAVLAAVTWLVATAIAWFPPLAVRVNGPALARFAGLSAAIGFSLLVGPHASVLRASLMLLCATMAWYRSRGVLPVYTLALAGLAMLVWQPLFLWQVGFQLSFVAVFGIILALRNSDARSRLFVAVLVSFAASSFTAPLTAHHFGLVSLIGPLINLVALPLAAAIVVLGGVGAFCSALGFGSSVLAVAGQLAGYLHMFAVEAGQLPGASVEYVLSWPVVAAILACLCLLAIKPRVSLVITAIGAVLVCGIWGTYSNSERGTLTIDFVDVGQGDAALIQFPDGRHALVDAGPMGGRA